MEDRGPWMHGMIIDGNSEDHWRWSYQVWVMKTGRVIMQKMKHIQ